MKIMKIGKNKHGIEASFNIVDGAKFIDSKVYRESYGTGEIDDFRDFYDLQVKPDPYAVNVRDRAMIKVEFNPFSQEIKKSDTQQYFQTYSANDSDGGKARNFPLIEESLLDIKLFKDIISKDSHWMKKYCEYSERKWLTLSIHFIRYKAEQGKASYSSPVWLHVDNEPLVFIHLVRLTDNAIGADNIISGGDNKPTNVIRLETFMDTLIVDPNKKHAVTPLGSKKGTAYRDVMLINLEADVQQL